ncbi:MAG: hypothetical protein A2669_00970 [Candidatus Yanofskybacteria bacterium RIFCSPHIGHO2_01_FULL_48_25b]|uniref:Uncharacterized protein n=2 Tax=Parcubacteria group TaxID=1794811 RepID=A0A1F8EYZ8_9BACT|nr:MAG: hypothetical protein A2669_00970 [Candidatus Yanofskybacteria bacterium RIFCSPHIGHO2_01_FULL_48_25b]
MLEMPSPPKFTQEDLNNADKEFREAEDALNAINFKALDWNEAVAQQVVDNWKAKRARYHEIRQALGHDSE